VLAKLPDEDSPRGQTEDESILARSYMNPLLRRMGKTQ
jgi:hypothetical protein